MQQTVAGENISVNVSRAVSNLKSIFVTFDNRNNLIQGQTQYMKEFNNFITLLDNWNIRFR